MKSKLTIISKKPRDRFKGLRCLATFDTKTNTIQARPDIAKRMYQNILAGCIKVTWEKPDG